MAEYIEREALFHAMKMDIRPPFAVVRDFPSADVVQVVHGRWVYGEDADIQCSICGADALTEGDYMQTKSNYCPNCGAKMDLEEKQHA